MIGTAFVVIRGPALAGKTSVARALASRLPGKTACISQDDLWEQWIVRHDQDVSAEAALVYRQIKLLAASYIRERYHVVIDGSYAVCRDGVAATHDADLRELLGLVSTIPNVRPLFVAVTARLELLLKRAERSDRWDVASVRTMHLAFEHSLPSQLHLDTTLVTPEEAAAAILTHMETAQ
jgi:chloramphenicol 3-O-phosphotransferase